MAGKRAGPGDQFTIFWLNRGSWLILLFAQLSSSHYRKVGETLKLLKTKGCFIHVDRAKADSKYHQSPVTVPGRIPPPQLSPQKF